MVMWHHKWLLLPIVCREIPQFPSKLEKVVILSSGLLYIWAYQIKKTECREEIAGLSKLFPEITGATDPQNVPLDILHNAKKELLICRQGPSCRLQIGSLTT